MLENTNKLDLMKSELNVNNTNLDLINTNLNLINNNLDLINTNLNSINTNINSNNSINAVNSNIDLLMEQLPLSSFDQIKVSNDTKIFNYIYAYGSTTLINNLKTPYNTLYGFSTSSTAKSVFNNSALSIEDTHLDLGKAAFIYSNTVPYISGTGIMAKFTAMFSNINSNSIQMIGLGNLSESNEISDFIGFQYDTEFKIVHYRNSILINSYTINQFNGTCLNLANYDFRSYLNIFKIQLQYLGAGTIKFFLEDFNTGRFQRIHTIKYPNSNNQSSLLNPSLGLIMYQNTTINNGPDYLKSCSFSLDIEGQPYNDQLMSSVLGSNTSVQSLTNIITIHNSTQFYSIMNRKPIRIISISVSVDGTKNSILYLKQVLNRPDGTYLKLDVDKSPVEYTLSNITINNGSDILIVNLAKNDKQFIDMSNYNIILFPGMSLICAVTSASNTSAAVSISWKNM
jgi:hypothetical protein